MDFDDRVRGVIAEQHDEIAALRAENERLSDFVRETIRMVAYECGCCNHFDQCQAMPEDADCLFVVCAREMGIEYGNA